MGLGCPAAAAGSERAPSPAPFLDRAEPSGRHDGLRCGDRLVEIGDTTAEVRLRCGPPATRDRWTETDEEGRVVVRHVEEWIYEGEYGSFPRVLRFVNNRLRSVRAIRR